MRERNITIAFFKDLKEYSLIKNILTFIKNNVKDLYLIRKCHLIIYHYLRCLTKEDSLNAISRNLWFQLSTYIFQEKNKETLVFIYSLVNSCLLSFPFLTSFPLLLLQKEIWPRSILILHISAKRNVEPISFGSDLSTAIFFFSSWSSTASSHRKLKFSFFFNIYLMYWFLSVVRNIKLLSNTS